MATSPNDGRVEKRSRRFGGIVLPVLTFLLVRLSLEPLAGPAVAGLSAVVAAGLVLFGALWYLDRTYGR